MQVSGHILIQLRNSLLIYSRRRLFHPQPLANKTKLLPLSWIFICYSFPFCIINFLKYYSLVFFNFLFYFVRSSSGLSSVGGSCLCSLLLRFWFSLFVGRAFGVHPPLSRSVDLFALRNSTRNKFDAHVLHRRSLSSSLLCCFKYRRASTSSENKK